MVGGCVCCGSGGCSVVPMGSSKRGLAGERTEGVRGQGHHMSLDRDSIWQGLKAVPPTIIFLYRANGESQSLLGSSSSTCSRQCC